MRSCHNNVQINKKIQNIQINTKNEFFCVSLQFFARSYNMNFQIIQRKIYRKRPKNTSSFVDRYNSLRAVSYSINFQIIQRKIYRKRPKNTSSFVDRYNSLRAVTTWICKSSKEKYTKNTKNTSSFVDRYNSLRAVTKIIWKSSQKYEKYKFFCGSLQFFARSYDMNLQIIQRKIYKKYKKYEFFCGSLQFLARSYKNNLKIIPKIRKIQVLLWIVTILCAQLRHRGERGSSQPLGR